MVTRAAAFRIAQVRRRAASRAPKYNAPPFESFERDVAEAFMAYARQREETMLALIKMTPEYRYLVEGQL